ncbi:uncharacterized protein N7446_010617 [Penicillium canescens]|uniref:uncharacterized protein n=1 Tax=Penicillium canescens TaxID=5083 RepID=UPI0026E06930|nr:uncharacterized protein N7446_010617 [Penicillium canescens]KAJ6050508.1 hypothetical protein N7446_010617 [Penicillium canescens]KAJ6064810.1 hypothetical protein N7444_000463 [Penicillium canescens]
MRQIEYDGEYLEEFVHPQYGQGYFADTDAIHEQDPVVQMTGFVYADYPLPWVAGMTYLGHAGTTLFAKSFIQSFSDDIMSSHHPMLVSSQRSTRRTDDVRLQVLQFFNANPNGFDLVFVANATAAMKLIGDLFRDAEPTLADFGMAAIVIGVRELADINSQCFDDADVEAWITELSTAQSKFPSSQSNMNGRRLPLRWCAQLRSVACQGGNVSTLLDASSFLSTAPLDFGEANTAPNTAPDFTAFSFHKIFGFPDLGALIVRKCSGSLLERRKLFGRPQWHAKKDTSIPERLNNDTLPFQSIIALDAAISTSVCTGQCLIVPHILGFSLSDSMISCLY